MTALKKLVIIISFLAFATPAHAGMMVFDLSNLVQAIMGYVNDIKVAYDTAKSLSYQYQQLEIAIKQARGLDSDQIRARLMNNLRQLVDLQQKAKGITYDYGRIESTFDSHYPDMPAYSGMSGRDYATQATKANQQLQNSIRDAMIAQGLVSNSANDQEALNALVAASNSAPGQLAAAQAGNQIAAMSAQQLIQLQQIMATSAREQSSYMATIAASNAKKIKAKDPDRAFMKDSNKNMMDYLIKK